MTRRQGLLALNDWLTAAEASDLPELRSFANGIRRDQQAVTAGLALPGPRVTGGLAADSCGLSCQPPGCPVPRDVW